MADPLPAWLVVGAPRSGTTALAAWLSAHSELAVPADPDVSFFDLHWSRGLDWYAAQFPNGGSRHTGEVTPAYMYSDVALDRIKRTSPEVRLILILREPVSRLWSQFWYFRAMGIDRRSFDTVLEDERRDPINTPRHIPVGYLDCSRYAPRVRAIQERFPGQLLVEFFEDLRLDAEGVTARICRHLNVGEPADMAVKSRNQARLVRSPRVQSMTLSLARLPGGQRPARWLRARNLTSAEYPAMPAARRVELAAEFAPLNRDLAALVDRPLPGAWAM